MTTTSTADNLYAIELIIEIDRGKYKTPFPAPSTTSRKTACAKELKNVEEDDRFTIITIPSRMF